MDVRSCEVHVRPCEVHVRSCEVHVRSGRTGLRRKHRQVSPNCQHNGVGQEEYKGSTRVQAHKNTIGLGLGTRAGARDRDSLRVNRGQPGEVLCCCHVACGGRDEAQLLVEEKIECGVWPK